MNVRVQLFAGARDRAGTDTAELRLDGGHTVADIRQQLLTEYPGLEPIAAHLLFAVDDSYASDDAVVSDGSRLACFPPVSGG